MPKSLAKLFLVCNSDGAWIEKKNTCVFVSDIDECAIDRSLCQPYGSCENRPGSYVCVCNHGYALAEDKHSCEGEPSLSLPALV